MVDKKTIDSMLNRLASDYKLPPFDPSLTSALLYKLLLEEGGNMSSTCQNVLLGITASLIRERAENICEESRYQADQIIARLKRA